MHVFGEIHTLLNLHGAALKWSAPMIQYKMFQLHQSDPSSFQPNCRKEQLGPK